MNFLPEKDTILLSLLDMEMRRPHINYQSHKSAPYQWGPSMKRMFILKPYDDRRRMIVERLLLKRKLQCMVGGTLAWIVIMLLVSTN